MRNRHTYSNVQTKHIITNKFSRVTVMHFFTHSHLQKPGIETWCMRNSISARKLLLSSFLRDYIWLINLYRVHTVVAKFHHLFWRFVKIRLPDVKLKKKKHSQQQQPKTVHIQHYTFASVVFFAFVAMHESQDANVRYAQQMKSKMLIY